MSISYHNKRVIGPLSLTIPAGKITAIIGPSGCGKSSFLLSLNRLTDEMQGCHSSGDIKIDGQSIFSDHINLHELRRKHALIAQKPNPFPFSIRKNLCLALEEHKLVPPEKRAQAIEQALTSVGLWQEVKDRLNMPATSLSGGQQQRLCLARALILEPTMLLLDEPCSALDPMATETIEHLLLELKGRLTLVIVTHNLAQARRIADRTALIWIKEEGGYLEEFGPTEALFSAPKSPLAKAYVDGLKG